MPSRARLNSRYETSVDNGGVIAPCQVVSGTIGAEIDGVSNDPPAGAVNNRGSATTSQGKRTAGINMRTVTLKFTGALPSNEYVANSRVRIPVLTPATYAVWAVRGKTGTYRGSAVEVVGFSQETVR
jgi:hypothetical protein